MMRHKAPWDSRWRVLRARAARVGVGTSLGTAVRAGLLARAEKLSNLAQQEDWLAVEPVATQSMAMFEKRSRYRLLKEGASLLLDVGGTHVSMRTQSFPSVVRSQDALKRDAVVIGHDLKRVVSRDRRRAG
jgi:hypothetical protein